MDEQRIDATGTEWRIAITDADIRAAKKAWQAACEGEASLARTHQLHESYRGLVRLQAQQIAEEFRARLA
ncbi:hypothetical protein [Cellulomonas soli]|uniref:hypothetical protein n=1 Tax=Cellulomonas soli TaxID=931535 RepID=UPI0011BF2901|nr:hypothetical protein [Cellulomonas soli]NYI59353.1 uncharacterized 2Fe-2S/4Fe-4S cluster protein (DUF4445 family) [Cellulomonas soli]